MSAPFYAKHFIDDNQAEKTILYEKINNARSLVLNRPEQLNAVDTPLLLRMLRLVKTCEFSKDINLVVLKGKGRAFCVGGDLKHLKEVFVAPDPEIAMRGLQLYAQIYELHHLLATMKKPVIAIMNGLTCGVGTGLAAFSTFRIATEKTRLAMPETSTGTFCDMGSSFFMPRLDFNVGVYMALTARFLKGEDVYLSGFATHFVHSSKLEALEARLHGLKENNLEMVNSIIEEYAVGENHEPSNYTLTSEVLEKINNWFQYDTVEEIVNALQNDGSEFALKAANDILSNSPTCLKLTLENYKLGKNMTLVNCLRMETRIWHVVPFITDFQNGVQCKLISKSKPEWYPKRLEDVDLELDIVARIVNAFGPVRYWEVYDEDYYERPYNYTLPTTKEIFEAQLVNNLDTVDKAIKYFKKNGREKKYGIVEKVTAVLGSQSHKDARLIAKL